MTNNKLKYNSQADDFEIASHSQALVKCVLLMHHMKLPVPEMGYI